MNGGRILYLAGPMTGLPDDNFPAFHAAAARLRDAGFEVVNPAELGLPKGLPWLSYMRAAVGAMVSTCDAVATLPGCEASRGAIAEIGLATHLGWPVHRVADWLDMARATAEAEHLLEP